MKGSAEKVFFRMAVMGILVILLQLPMSQRSIAQASAGVSSQSASRITMI